MSKQVTILVVDADPSFRESLANHLLACGIESFEMASSTTEAVEEISRSSFDIILVDLFMPNMKGLHFAQELRKLVPETKIVLLIDDQQLPALDAAGQSKLNFPTILKSFVIRTLPQLLSEESNSLSLKRL